MPRLVSSNEHRRHRAAICASRFDRISNNLASAFKLDYVGVESSRLKSSRFSPRARHLAKGLTIDFRRQMTAQANQKLKFDLRLVYRIPSRDKFLSRLRLSLGVDQNRPWRIGFDYITRF